jgi:ubiquinone/menaquinone biosynthesis C-methylase UbiE
MTEENQLEFTGERFTPECVREIWYEHYHRYAFASKIIKGKKVLDIACGEGYGSRILAQQALSVIGMDIDAGSVIHAQNKYQMENLSYEQGSCLEIPLPDNSIDAVISFETLEHLAEHELMLSEFNRVLTADGLLLISTPDKKHYSDATGFTNEYHVKELYKPEFKALLDQHWQAQTWFAQALSFHSIMEKIDVDNTLYSSDILKDGNLIKNKDLIKSMYYIVLASKDEKSLPPLPDLHLFADAEQSIYQHYNEVIRDVIAYGEELMKLRSHHEKLMGIPFLGRIVRFFEKRF